MFRRQYLVGSAVSAGLLAGCLGGSGGRATQTPRPEISIVGRDAPPDLPVRPTVEVVRAAAGDDGPPALRATLENVADHRIEVGEERAVVFAFVVSEERPGLTLLPEGGDYPAAEPDCWRLAEPIAIAEYYGVVELAPGETHERTIEVWGSPEGVGCLPEGQFRFETQYAGAQDRNGGVDEREWHGSWGFTLAVW